MKYLQLALVLLCGTVLHAQTTAAIRVDPTPVFTISSRVAGTNPPILGVSGASISVCSYPANAVPCTNLATTYTDATMAVSCPTYAQLVLATTSTCVAQTDIQGNFGFWIGVGTYSYTITINGASYGPYYVTAGSSAAVQSYKAPFTGAVTTTVPAKIAQANLSLADFCGNAGTTPLSSSGCWANAQTAAAATSNQQLYVPAGTYSVDSALRITSPLQISCDTGATFIATGTSAIFIPQSNGITISGCAFDGGYTVNGNTSNVIDSSATVSGSYGNWDFQNITISDAGGKSIQMCGGAATVNGWHLSGFNITATSRDNGGGVISLGPGCSNVLMDGGWKITSTTFNTPNTDGIQLVANVSAGTHPFQNITIKDGTLNYGGGKIPIEAGNYCANPCTFLGGPITITNVDINAGITGQYGYGVSFGNGIGHSSISNIKINMNGVDPASSPSQCIELAQSGYNTVSYVDVSQAPAGCQIVIDASYNNQVSYNNIPATSQAGINITNTQWSVNTNYNTIDHNTITSQAATGFAIYLQNNTSGIGSFQMNHNRIESNNITFSNAACPTASSGCQGIRIENDGTTGGLAYTQILNNKIFSSQYPIAFNSATPVHTVLSGNQYDSSNYNQFVGTSGSANIDAQTDPGNGTADYAMPGIGCQSATPTVVANAGSGTGASATLTGCNMVGTVVITSGTSPSATPAILATITFNPVKSAHCLVTNNQNGSTAVIGSLQVGNPSNSFTISGVMPTGSGQQYFVNYFCPSNY